MKPSLFKKTKYVTTNIIRSVLPIKEEEVKPNIPEGIVIKCPECGKNIYVKDLMKQFKVCQECKAHLKVSAYERVKMTLDDGSFEEYDRNLMSNDPLDFPDYKQKLIKLQIETGLIDGVVTAKGKINSMPVMMGIMDSSFMMGSMGTVVGEKLARLFEKAIEERLPVIVFTASGGARMQEGIFSLMQMAKVSGAVAKHSAAGLLYISVLTNPTTGGVTASFAMQGDIIISEPKALIGFAGPRVIEQTIRQKLPDGFQRAEFLLEHGFIDLIVGRYDMKETLSDILRLHKA